jgi:predicted transcriptional regulator
MKFDQFADVLSRVQYTYGVDAIDIEMIHQVKRLKNLEGEARVMSVVATNRHEGKTTAHKRIQNLIKRGFLKVSYSKDGRIKLLDLGPFALEMTDAIWEEKESIL